MNFFPSQYEPSIFALLVGQAGSSNQEVMEGGESRFVMCLRYVRAVSGQEFYGKHGLEEPILCHFNLPTQIRRPGQPMGVVWSRFCSDFHTSDASELNGLGSIPNVGGRRNSIRDVPAVQL